MRSIDVADYVTPAAVVLAWYLPDIPRSLFDATAAATTPKTTTEVVVETSACAARWFGLEPPPGEATKMMMMMMTRRYPRPLFAPGRLDLPLEIQIGTTRTSLFVMPRRKRPRQ
jgi:hypothetical protein